MEVKFSVAIEESSRLDELEKVQEQQSGGHPISRI
jgi:hypothetical protein